MKITQLSLENFLSYKEKTVIDPLRDVTVFVGPNNSGKSNVVKAFQFLRSLAAGSWEIPFGDILFDKTGKNFNIELKVELSDDERRSIISKNLDLQKIFEKVDLTKNPIFKFLRYVTTINVTGCTGEVLYTIDENGNEKPILQRQMKDGNINILACDLADHIKASGSPSISDLDMIGKGNAKIEVGIFTNGSSAFEYQFSTFLTTNLLKIKIYGAHRRAAVKVPGGEQRMLAETGQNLIGVLNTIQGNKSTEFVRIMDIYRGVIGEVDSVNLPPVGNEYTVRLDEHGLKSQTDFSNISTGLHQLMILIVAMEQAVPGQILLIEEPEVHLHASSQKRLFRLITNKSEQNQIIVTTHSSIFTGINEKTVNYVATRSQGISKLNLVDTKEDLQFIKKQLGIRNSDVYGDDHTIFVEGDSEETAFPIVAKAIGFEKFGNEVKLVNLKGDSKILKLDMFLEYLKGQDTNTFLIADGGTKIANKVEDYIHRELIHREHTKVWEKEFEDIFDSEILISCMQKIANEQEFEFNFTTEELNESRKSEQKATKIISKYLRDKNLPDLDKPELAKKLAEHIAKNTGKDGVKITPFEEEIRKIMKIVDSKHDQESLLHSLKIDSMNKDQAKQILETLKRHLKED